MKRRRRIKIAVPTASSILKPPYSCDGKGAVIDTKGTKIVSFIGFVPGEEDITVEVSEEEYRAMGNRVLEEIAKILNGLCSCNTKPQGSKGSHAVIMGNVLCAVNCAPEFLALGLPWDQSCRLEERLWKKILKNERPLCPSPTF